MRSKIMLALLLALMLTLVGCNGCNKDTPTSSTPDSNVSTPVDDGISRPESDEGQSAQDDGEIDLDMEPDSDGDATDTTTTTTGGSTAPTAGDFNDPNNFIEVPLG